MLARQGYDPIILERGSEVHTRMEGECLLGRRCFDNVECNVQFGEGRCRYFFRWQAQYSCQGSFWTTEKVMETFVEAGAPKDILYVQKPHVGTDLLVGIVEKLRNEILRQRSDSV